MPKQTVEDAASAYAEYTDESPRGRIETRIEAEKYEGFIAGSHWQKEQGIEWIDAATNSPVATHGYVINVLITDGIKMAFCDFETTSNVFLRPQFLPTHWAYINLPKTD